MKKMGKTGNQYFCLLPHFSLHVAEARKLVCVSPVYGHKRKALGSPLNYTR